MIRHLQTRTLSAVRPRIGALGCILLIFLVSLVSVTHVHPASSRAPEHSCSVCALIHSGLAPADPSAHLLVFESTALALLPAVKLAALVLISSFYIRPPPALTPAASVLS